MCNGYCIVVVEPGMKRTVGFKMTPFHPVREQSLHCAKYRAFHTHPHNCDFFLQHARHYVPCNCIISFVHHSSPVTMFKKD